MKVMVPGDALSVTSLDVFIELQAIRRGLHFGGHLPAASDLSQQYLDQCVGPQPGDVVTTVEGKGGVRVASRNFVTDCLTEDVTREVIDEALYSLLTPYPHSLLKSVELAQVVPAWVAGLKLDE